MDQQNKIFLMRPSVGDEEIELVRQVVESKWLTDGPTVKEFEQAVAVQVGAKHAISATSAAIALELCLRALGVGLGDEVIVPDFTHPATALCVMAVGAEPVLVDVDLKTCNTTAELIEAAITNRTKAAIPVSIFGNPLDIEPINALRDKYGITIIEDAACSLGSALNGKPIGSLTDMTVFSFHPRKIFSMGEGGVITTDNDEWAAEMNSIKRFGVKKVDGEAKFVQWGTNYRLSGILAAVGLGQVRKVDRIVEDRRTKAEYYNQLLANVPGVSLPKVLQGAKHNYQTYVIYLQQDGARDRLLKELRFRGIEVQIGTFALHLQPFFTESRRVGSLENSASLYQHLLSLPLHHELTQEDQERVVQELRAAL
ncbi:MAG: DegT/DnrJ/EryC1/StrS family aminotransferase [Anaerolineae bacterium]